MLTCANVCNECVKNICHDFDTQIYMAVKLPTWTWLRELDKDSACALRLERSAPGFCWFAAIRVRDMRLIALTHASPPVPHMHLPWNLSQFHQTPWSSQAYLTCTRQHVAAVCSEFCQSLSTGRISRSSYRHTHADALTSMNLRIFFLEVSMLL